MTFLRQRCLRSVCPLFGATLFFFSTLSGDEAPLTSDRGSSEEIAGEPAQRFNVKLDGKSRRFSVGVAKPNERRRLLVLFQNPSEADLKIRDVTVSCGCMEIIPGKSIVPGLDSTSLQISVDASANLGRHNHSITATVQDSSRRVFEQRVGFFYEVVGDFDVQLPNRVWVVDRRRTGNPQFDFVIRGFRDFDLDNVEVAVEGLDSIGATITRNNVDPLSNETSRVECSIRLKSTTSADRPIPFEILISTKDEKTQTVSRERIVLFDRPQMTLSPAVPQIRDGFLTVFVRLLDQPKTEPQFELHQDSVKVKPDNVTMLSPQFYKLSFNAEALKNGPVDRSGIQGEFMGNIYFSEFSVADARKWGRQ